MSMQVLSNFCFWLHVHTFWYMQAANPNLATSSLQAAKLRALLLLEEVAQAGWEPSPRPASKASGLQHESTKSDQTGVLTIAQQQLSCSAAIGELRKQSASALDAGACDHFLAKAMLCSTRVRQQPGESTERLTYQDPA